MTNVTYDEKNGAKAQAEDHQEETDPPLKDWLTSHIAQSPSWECARVSERGLLSA